MGDSGHRSWQQWLLLCISLLVSVGVFWYLQKMVSWQELIGIIKKIPPAGIALFLLFSMTMSAFRCWRYLLLLKISGYTVRKIPLFLVTLVRNFFSDLLPARTGTLIFIYLARTKLGVSWSSASAGFAYSFIFDMISLGFLILLATLSATAAVHNPFILLGAGGFFAAVSTAVLFLLPALVQKIESGIKYLPFVPKIFCSRLYMAAKDLEKELVVLQQSRAYLPLLILSLGVRTFKYLALYVLLICLVIPSGYTLAEFPFSRVFFGLTAAEMAASLPISGIAGFGAYEGAWSLVFQLLGYPEKIAALTSISHHLLTQTYGYLLGALAFLLLLYPWKTMIADIHTDRVLQPLRFYVLAFLMFALPLLTAIPTFRAAVAASPGVKAGLEEKSSVHVPSVPAGKLAYQRPDGIYLLNLGENAEQQLTTSGIFPRWSPDGRTLAYIDGDTIKIMTAEGKNQKTLIQAGKINTICFSSDGRNIVYAEGDTVMLIEISSQKVSRLLSGHVLLEMDVSADGRMLVATEKVLGGCQVIAIQLSDGAVHRIARGCSASISPNGQISVNGSSHRQLFIFSSNDFRQYNVLMMVDGKKFDNHYWANKEDWLVSKSEGDEENIYLHHVPSGAAFQLTQSGQCDRPDVYISE